MTELFKDSEAAARFAWLKAPWVVPLAAFLLGLIVGGLAF